MAAKWHIVRIDPRADYLAAGELVRDGFEIFFPCVVTTHPRKGHADMPLFPGYLFLKCDPDAGGWPVFHPRHRVSGWVRLGGEIPSLPDETVVELRHRLERIERDGGLRRRFSPGEKVRIVSSTIESIAEVVEDARSSQGRVKVLLRFMGRLVSAQVPQDHLRPFEDQASEKPMADRRTRGRGRWVRGFGPRAALAT